MSDETKLTPTAIMRDVFEALTRARMRSFEGSTKQVRTFMTAYQLFRELPDPLRERLILESGDPVDGPGTGAAWVVAKAGEMLVTRGLADVEYLDTRHFVFDVSRPASIADPTQPVRFLPPSFEHCSLFRWNGTDLEAALERYEARTRGKHA